MVISSPSAVDRSAIRPLGSTSGAVHKMLPVPALTRCFSVTPLTRQHAAKQFCTRAAAQRPVVASMQAAIMGEPQASLQSVDNNIVPSTLKLPAIQGKPQEVISETSPIDPAAQKPGDADRTRFREHWSVPFWRNFKADPEGALDASNAEVGIPARLQAVARSLNKQVEGAGMLESPQALAYWTYHFGRSSFFSVQGLTGLAASRLGQAASSSGGGASDTLGAADRGADVWVMSAVRLFLEAIAMYKQDYDNIREGFYKLPWDMSPRHRQFNPAYVARKGLAFLRDASDTLTRRATGQKNDVWLSSGMYPSYYMNTFHFQTDGWLSERSASVYESSTETLFIGRQDAMQRQTLRPLAEWMAERQAPASGAGLKLLEVGCGTGRFATFVKDNWSQMEVTLSDLSPYYLQEARENMRYWRGLRAPNQALGGPDGTGVRFLQAPAEKIPEPDASYDAVVSIYLFHELPPEARRAAVFEMARLLKPGGIAVLTDSAQLGDRPSQDAYMGRFGDFNEPFYRTYISTDFGALFEEAGLECDMKMMASATKVLSFRKPLRDGNASAAPPQLTTAALAEHSARLAN